MFMYVFFKKRTPYSYILYLRHPNKKLILRMKKIIFRLSGLERNP